MKALGRVCNVIAAASGVAIPLTRATGVMFVCYESVSGSTVLTITEVDSTGTNTEQALTATVYPFKAPGAGGTWTAVAESGTNTVTLNDAVNDSIVFGIDAPQLSDGYDSVKVTASAGTVTAVLHDLLDGRAPDRLESNLTA